MTFNVFPLTEVRFNNNVYYARQHGIYRVQTFHLRQALSGVAEVHSVTQG